MGHDRELCNLPASTTAEAIAQVPDKGSDAHRELAVFKVELPDWRLVFAAAVFDLDKPTPSQPPIECLWNIKDAHYLDSSNVALGPATRGVRIDIEDPFGDVQVATIVGVVDGKPQNFLSFRPLERCTPSETKCWNYSRTMTVLPGDENKQFHDIRIDTRSWCTPTDGARCLPENGPQDFTTPEFFTFAGASSPYYVPAQRH